jgi:SAM-dependent methyltransferase
LVGHPALGGGVDYDAYLQEETAKSLRMSTRFCLERRATLFLQKHVYPAHLIVGARADLARLAASAVSPGITTPRVLSVGSRDELELVILRKIFPTAIVTGLDLFACDPAIQRGDMHALPFADGAFDVVVSSHCLEHAFDLERAVSELTRVVAPGGVLVIEVPVKHVDQDGPRPQSTGSSDRWDFGNLRSLLRTVEGAARGPVEVLHGRDANPGARQLQLIVRLGGTQTSVN